MKKFLTILLVLGAMYITAKWPQKIISTGEMGYRVVTTIVQSVRTAKGGE